MASRDEFIEIYRENIQRDGADKLLDYLEKRSDFFTAPAALRGNGAYEGALCDHSVNVYHCLVDFLMRERVQDFYGLEYSQETIAIVSLLHDVCKVGCYKPSVRSIKDPQGQLKTVTTYTFDDPLPYGHGEKSVYIVNGFLRLSREEAMAIRWHMGYASTDDRHNVEQAFRKFPLACVLALANTEALFLTDGRL